MYVQLMQRIFLEKMLLVARFQEQISGIAIFISISAWTGLPKCSKILNLFFSFLSDL
jgi:hypothetical protein